MSAKEPDPFQEFTITFRALPDAFPAAVRVRRMLKYALRVCGLRNVGWGDVPPAGDSQPVGADY